MSTIKTLFHHVNGEPAMAIVRKQFGKGRAFVVCLSAAHKYTDDEYLMTQSIKCCEVLGLTPSLDAHKICDAILAGLDKLVSMPPPPREAKRTVGHGVVTVDGVSNEFKVTE